MRALLALTLLLMLAVPTFGMGVRLDDIGQGAAPGLALVVGIPYTEGMDVDLRAAAGFGSMVTDEAGAIYFPRGDISAKMGSVFGRIGAWLDPEKEWFPFYGGGLAYGITDHFGVEFFYVFGFDKTPDALQYTETREGNLVLNFWADF